MTDFRNSQTKTNLMKAFAGESQARNRYTFAAGQARNHNLQLLEQVFTFTAGQEKEHAEIFYNHLKDLVGEKIFIEADYPVDRQDTIAELLRSSQENEYDEWQNIYKEFGSKASEEGFMAVAQSFFKISEIEKTHGDRFAYFAELLEQGKLFSEEAERGWMCLNCGHIEYAEKAPELCPVCFHTQGYFIREELAPYTS